MRIHLFKNCSSLMRGLLIALAGLAAGSVHAQVQGVSDTEIVLGSAVDLSGPIASLGVPIREGMTVAAEEINAAGGIHGRKIRLLVEDTGYDPKKSVLATQKLLTQDRVFAMVGMQGSVTAIASMPLAIERGVPFLFAVAASDATYVPLHPLKFGILTTYGDQTRAAVKFAHDKLGKRRFGILYQDDENGQAALRAVNDQLKVHGLATTEVTSYKRGEIEYSAQMARLKAANVDVVILGTAGTRDTAGAAIEARKLGWNVDMIAGVGASTTQVIKLGGQAMEGVYCTFQYLNSSQEATPALRAMLDRFKTRFGHEPADLIAIGYNNIMLFAEGAKNAGRNLTPQTLSQGLEKVKNFKTIFEAPPVSFSPGDHSPPRTTIIMQVRGGKYVRVTGPITY